MRSGASNSVRAALPLLVAAATPLLLAAAGLTQRDLFGTVAEDRFYGFFFDRYPLFVFAIVYGLAAITVDGVTRAGRPGWLRVVTVPAAAALFLALCLHPTFGGFILRPGYFTGGVGFLNGLPAGVATTLGAAAAGFMLALGLGLCGALARLRLSLRWRAWVRGLLAVLALWFALALLNAPRTLGIAVAGGWPALPIPWPAALTTALLVTAAFLPHAALRRRA